jgi:hypothetical protein
MLPDSLARRPLLPLVLITAMVVALSAVAAAVTAGPFSGALRRLGPVILVGIGVSMTVAGTRRRVGLAERCAACDYERRPAAGGSPVCPECGALWNRPGGTERGRLVQNRILFWCGLAVVVAYAAGPFSALVLGRSVHLRLVPTRLLIDRIGDDGFAPRAWNELQCRRLSAEQQVDLAQRLLDKRRRGNTLRREDRLWLESMVGSGALPARLVQRFDDER